MARSESRVDIRSAFLGGLAAALLVTAAPAIADVGDALLAGRFNTVDKKTTISGEAPDDAMFKIANGAANGSGITIQVEPGNPPLTVDSAKRVKRLNADKVDGHHADEFLLDGELSAAAHGQIRSNGTIRSGSSNVIDVTKPGVGQYCVALADLIAQPRLEGTVVGLAGSATTAQFVRLTNGQQPFVCPSGNLVIQVTDQNGAPVDGRFSFVVP